MNRKIVGKIAIKDDVVDQSIVLKYQDVENCEFYKEIVANLVKHYVIRQELAYKLGYRKVLSSDVIDELVFCKQFSKYADEIDFILNNSELNTTRVTQTSEIIEEYKINHHAKRKNRKRRRKHSTNKLQHPNRFATSLNKLTPTEKRTIVHEEIPEYVTKNMSVNSEGSFDTYTVLIHERSFNVSFKNKS